MLIRIKTSADIPSSEITPESVYRSRRDFMKVAAAGAVGAVAGSLLAGGDGRATAQAPALATLPNVKRNAAFTVDEKVDPLTSYAQITSFNNYYEFGGYKSDPARTAGRLKVKPWTVKVDGLVNKPGNYALEDFIKPSKLEERIYRMRCVEAWSMVIPWAGFSLSRLLARVLPMSSAKYVAFQTLHDPERMPNQRTGVLAWPYVEGLRIDEAMHPLALLATGLYGEELPPQDGAPVRLVTPWKYGFKGIKSIVRITLTETQPPSTWSNYAPREYGFFANVNPHHDHPRWSQATEQRIGESGRRKTLMFNGYADQVASLYAGMDLDVHY